MARGRRVGGAVENGRGGAVVEIAGHPGQVEAVGVERVVEVRAGES